MNNELNNYLQSIGEHLQQICSELDALREKANSDVLNNVETRAVERLLQVLIEAGVGIAKQWLKAEGHTIRSSAYNNFEALHQEGHLDVKSLQTWKSMIGLRNAIVHDYMNLNQEILLAVLTKKMYMEAFELLTLAKQC